MSFLLRCGNPLADVFVYIIFFQELKEQNELLYDTKVVLEEQLTGLNTKEERIGEQISMGRVVRHIFKYLLQITSMGLLRPSIKLHSNERLTRTF